MSVATDFQVTYTVDVDRVAQHLATRHNDLRDFIATLLEDGDGATSLLAYFAKRAHYLAASRQDLLPLLIYETVGERPYQEILPLTAAWSLQLAASHLLDEVQDTPLPKTTSWCEQVSTAVLALGAANIALAQQQIGREHLPEIIAAMGEITVTGIVAQQDELRRSGTWATSWATSWSKEDYFYNIASKSAAIIATGIWLGAILTVVDEQSVTMLQEFGLALGMAMQIADDCLDLAEDLEHGTHTLAVIEGLALTAHPEQATLCQMLKQQPLSPGESEAIVAILERMGVVSACRRVARAYQVQAAAALNPFPNLIPLFSDYVTVEA